MQTSIYAFDQVLTATLSIADQLGYIHLKNTPSPYSQTRPHKKM